MGRPKLDYSEALKFSTRPESAQALLLLSEVTGLARTALLRVALDQFLVSCGVGVPVHLTPTVPCVPSKEH